MRHVGLLFIVLVAGSIRSEEAAVKAPGLFARENLMAWCIVPFDAKKRGPVERAEMLARLGITKFAYDWRDEHVPTFDAEIEALKAKKIELSAWWFPGALNAHAKTILETLKRHNEHPQLWTMIGDPKGANQAEKIAAAVAAVWPIADAAAAIGCKVGLYNHGGWFGEPENQMAIIDALRMPNVGMVYNFHHGHAHVSRFAELFRKMQPYLLAVNINGMARDGEKLGKKILEVGAGNDELAMLKVVRESGWRGPIGVLCHRAEIDAGVALKGNLDGLRRLCTEHPELEEK